MASHADILWSSSRVPALRWVGLRDKPKGTFALEARQKRARGVTLVSLIFIAD